MLLAVCRLLALNIEARKLSARVMGATLAHNVHHAIQSMLAAVRQGLAAFDVVGRSRHTGVMGAAPVADVYHSVLGMFPAVFPPLAALDIEFWRPRARVM